MIYCERNTDEYCYISMHYSKDQKIFTKQNKTNKKKYENMAIFHEPYHMHTMILPSKHLYLGLDLHFRHLLSTPNEEFVNFDISNHPSCIPLETIKVDLKTKTNLRVL